MNNTKPSPGVAHTVQDFWATRPLRPRNGRKLAGVSAAVGIRYGIDPILVRVFFVAATFYGGAGILLYLLCWALFPKEGEPAADTGEPAREPTPVWLVVVLILMMMPILGFTRFPTIIAVLAGLAGLYLLHTKFGDRQRLPAPDGDPAAQPDAAEGETRTPPKWDPLGAAPFAWDLPDPGAPGAPEQPPGRHYRWLPFAVLGATLLTCGLLFTLGVPLFLTLAITLAVLGAGLIAGSLLHTGRSLLLVAIPFAVLTLVAGDIHDDEGEYLRTRPAADELNLHPATVEQLQPRYERAAGTINLDLRDLGFSSENPVRTDVHVDRGEITVYVPADVDVTATCHADLGRVDCLTESADGRAADRTVVDQGENGPGGGNLLLDLRANTGHVEVIRD